MWLRRVLCLCAVGIGVRNTISAFYARNSSFLHNSNCTINYRANRAILLRRGK